MIVPKASRSEKDNGLEFMEGPKKKYVSICW